MSELQQLVGEKRFFLWGVYPRGIFWNRLSLYLWVSLSVAVWYFGLHKQVLNKIKSSIQLQSMAYLPASRAAWLSQFSHRWKHRHTTQEFGQPQVSGQSLRETALFRTFTKPVRMSNMVGTQMISQIISKICHSVKQLVYWAGGNGYVISNHPVPFTVVKKSV